MVGEADSRARLRELLLLSGEEEGGCWALINTLVTTLGASLRLLDVRLLHFYTDSQKELPL